MNKEKYKIIALIGEAGVGKDSIMQGVLKESKIPLHEIISCTTRPKREGEQEGVNYFYLSNEEFAAKVLNFEMLEATCFNDWFYGTAIQSLSPTMINIGVFNPDGIYALLESPKVDLSVYYVHATKKNRLLRQLNRENNPDVDEIIRRYKADINDFSDLDFEYQVLPNDTRKEFQQAIKTIVSQL